TAAVELERAPPRGARLLVSGRLGVFERRLQEAMSEPGINVELVRHVGGLERCAKLLDVVHSRAAVLVTPVAEDRAVHLRSELDRRCRATCISRKAVVRDRRRDVAAPRAE